MEAQNVQTADWLGQYFQSQDINFRASTIVNVTIRMESVWSCDWMMFKKTFYAIDRLGPMSYHIVFYYSRVLNEFKCKGEKLACIAYWVGTI